MELILYYSVVRLNINYNKIRAYKLYCKDIQCTIFLDSGYAYDDRQIPFEISFKKIKFAELDL